MVDVNLFAEVKDLGEVIQGFTISPHITRYLERTGETIKIEHSFQAHNYPGSDHNIKFTRSAKSLVIDMPQNNIFQSEHPRDNIGGIPRNQAQYVMLAYLLDAGLNAETTKELFVAGVERVDTRLALLYSQE